MKHETKDGKKSGWKGWLWMAACCIPMVVIAVLVALGFFGAW
jgi:nitrate reductase NapE component